MTIHYILLNGPKHSGKSTIARELSRDLDMVCEKKGASVIDSFAAPMKHFIATALGEQYSTMNKERAMPELNGESVRRFLVNMAEMHIKKIYGNDIFGKWLNYRNLRNPAKMPFYVIVDDNRFSDEASVLPLRSIIHIKRPWHEFGDEPTGTYLPNPNYVIENSGSIIDLYQAIRKLAHALYNGEVLPHA